jgi:hypothetical protein
MPGQYSSHDTSVSFDGVPIGWLTGFDWEAKAGQLFKKTNVTSRVVGSGSNARVVEEYDCTSVEPPTLSFTFWGPPSFAADDAGLRAEIVFDAPGATISGEAILVSFTHNGRAGQWATGAATFQLTGALGS